MGLFDLFNTKSLSPTVPAKERPKMIIQSFEEYTTKLYTHTPGINEYGDCREGIRLQLILGYLDAENKEAAINKIDPTTIKMVLSYYNSVHWANVTPTLYDLLQLIKNTSQRIDLMEIDIDRSIVNKNKTTTESLGCIPYACMYINDTNRIRIPIIEKKLTAYALVQACDCFTRGLIGDIYGSKLLIKDAKDILDKSRGTA